jgi:hypothetical protein
LPVWAELAPAEQWQDVEAPLGHLDLSQPVPDVRTWRYWEPCDPRGEEEFKRHLDEWDRQLREVHAGRREHQKTWNQLTYDLGTMTRDGHGRLRLDCKLGTYYHSLSTSECLDAELSEPYAAWPDTTLSSPGHGWSGAPGSMSGCLIRWPTAGTAQPRSASRRSRSCASATGPSTATSCSCRPAR